MPLQRHKFKPLGTVWVSVEVIVSYSCESPPKVESTKVTGLKQFGFVLSSEYDIEVMIDDYSRHPCHKSDCETAFRYDFDLKVFVADIIGLGLGLGGLGTGTAGWRFPATEEHHSLETPCICCDDKLAERQMFSEALERLQRRYDSIALILGFSALAVAGTLSVINFDHPSNLGKVFVVAASSGLLASLVVVFWKMAARVRRSNRNTDEQKRMAPMG